MGIQCTVDQQILDPVMVMEILDVPHVWLAHAHVGLEFWDAVGRYLESVRTSNCGQLV